MYVVFQVFTFLIFSFVYYILCLPLEDHLSKFSHVQGKLGSGQVMLVLSNVNSDLP